MQHFFLTFHSLQKSETNVEEVLCNYCSFGKKGELAGKLGFYFVNFRPSLKASPTRWDTL